MIRPLLIALALAISLPPNVFSQGVPVKVEYVKDIDDWRVEVFDGAANSDGFLQGPLREAGIGRNAWSMCSHAKAPPQGVKSGDLLPIYK